MSRFEAGERILEISEEMQGLLREAMDLLSEHGTDLDAGDEDYEDDWICEGTPPSPTETV